MQARKVHAGGTAPPFLNPRWTVGPTPMGGLKIVCAWRMRTPLPRAFLVVARRAALPTELIRLSATDFLIFMHVECLLTFMHLVCKWTIRNAFYFNKLTVNTKDVARF